MSTTRTRRLSGFEAIGFASARGLRLNKYADPIEEMRTDLTVTEARSIADEDPALIYLDVRAGRGRPRIEEKHPRIPSLLEAGCTDTEVALLTGCSAVSVARARKRLA
mgnify:CR=1 FL=1